MTRAKKSPIRGAEVVLPCPELDATLAFLRDRLGFRVDAVFPADDPAVAVLSGHGLRLRLDQNARGDPGTLRLLCTDPATVAAGARELLAPNGTRIELVEADPPLVLPPLRPAFVLSRLEDGAAWVEGRAGMLYRDLIPGRQGGRFVASHIRIPEGGPVADYVHFHRVRFQVIYCRAGWVEVVYEDQGPPFVLQAGDCVLQPPRIRHRVLASSPGLEVIEVSSPADHETLADHDLSLPTPRRDAERVFDGQRFVRHEAAKARWQPWLPGFEARDTGIGAATGGLAGVKVARPVGAVEPRAGRHGAELLFLFVLRGTARFGAGNDDHPLAAGDALVVPRGLRHELRAASGDLELLEVRLPAV